MLEIPSYALLENSDGQNDDDGEDDGNFLISPSWIILPLPTDFFLRPLFDANKFTISLYVCYTTTTIANQQHPKHFIFLAILLLFLFSLDLASLLHISPCTLYVHKENVFLLTLVVVHDSLIFLHVISQSNLALWMHIISPNTLHRYSQFYWPDVQ